MNTPKSTRDAPLVVVDVDLDLYKSWEGINMSALKAIRRSPAHFKIARYSHRPPTPSMALGTAVHAAILQPESYDGMIAVQREGINRRTKVGKAEYESWCLANSHKVMLTSEQHNTAKILANAAHARFRDTFDHERTTIEVGIQWAHICDDGMEELAKGRMDLVWTPKDGKGSDYILDVKTTEDASYDAFQRSVARYGYHVQAAWYAAGYEAVTGKPASHVILAIETSPPYGMAMYQLSKPALAQGIKEANEMMEIFHSCSLKDSWPDYGNVRKLLDIPSWAYTTDGEGASNG